MAEKKANVLKIAELQNKLMKTFQFQHYKSIDSYFIEGIKNGEVNIPTNGFYCTNLVPEHKQELIDLYDRTFGLYDGINDIPESIKVSQGALLDGLHYGYNLGTESFELYTMNPGLFDSDMLTLPEKMLNDIFKKNLVGELKSLRVDIEYQQSNKDDVIASELTYKLVNHRKAVNDNEEEVGTKNANEIVILVPVIAGIRLCSAIMSFLEKNFTLKVTQTVDGLPKIRCITQNKDILKHYCDDEAVVEAMNTTAQYYPYKGFFYVPVVGAPSVTSMVTNVNLFKLEGISKVNSYKEMQQMGIQKAKNGLETVISEIAIKTCLSQLKGNDYALYEETIDKIPNFKAFLTDKGIEEVSEKTIATYLHSSKHSDTKKMLSVVPNAKDKFNKLSGMFTKTTPIAVSELKDILKTNAVKVLVKKADFTLSSMICTNSPEILSMVYGENYVAYYEGFSVRVRKAIEEYRNGVSLKEAFLKYGFSTASAEAIALSFNESANPTDEEITNVAYTIAEKKQTASKQSDNIMVRTLDAYISENKVIDYYKYIDPNRVLSAFMLS